MQAHFLEHCWPMLGSILESFWEPSAPLYSSWGLCAWILALLCCTLFSVDFLINFGIQLGGGVGGWVGVSSWDGIPAPVCVCVCVCVFVFVFFVYLTLKRSWHHLFCKVFWISGFPVPVGGRERERERERLLEGTLPLSEVRPSDYLTECRKILDF